MLTKRLLLFLIGCIGIRTLITILAWKIEPEYLPYMGYVALLISFSFIYIYTFGSDTADRQLEWAGDRKIWWNDLRIVHGLLYLLFAIYAIQKKPFAYMPLMFDVMLGLTAWTIHHSISP